MNDTQELTNKQKLVFYLMDKGLSNDEVAQTLSDVAAEAFEQFTNEAMKVMTDADKQAIESCDSDILADEELKKRFSERTGEDAANYLDRLLEEHAGAYLSDSSSSQTASI